jgi:hypothetical protein
VAGLGADDVQTATGIVSDGSARRDGRSPEVADAGLKLLRRV